MSDESWKYTAYPKLEHRPTPPIISTQITKTSTVDSSWNEIPPHGRSLANLGNHSA